MAEERTEEEQIEALKAWWDENGIKTIAAIVLVVGGYFGWQYWEQSAVTQSEQAAALWQETTDVMATAQQGQSLSQAQQKIVNDNANLLKANHSGTAYAHFGAALKAKLAVENGDLDAAATELQWSLDKGSDTATETIMLLRLARVEAARGNTEQALELLQGVDPGAHKSAYEEAKGDFYMQLNNPDAAYTAYDSAIVSNQSGDAIVRNVLELKIGQVRPAEVPTQESPAEEPIMGTEMGNEGNE